MRRTNSKTALFLMELILMILLFALSAAVCMRIFAAAQTLSDGSRELNGAVMEAENAAESFKATGGDAEAAAALCSAAEASPGGFRVYYDEKWDGGAGQVYRLTLAEHEGYAEIEVCRTADGSRIYALTVKAVD